MINDLCQENLKALAALSCGDFEKTQKILRENARKWPSVLSFNNLGLYYLQNGIICVNQKVRSSQKIAMHYLEKAHNIDSDWRNCLNLASAYYENGCIECAEKLLCESQNEKCYEINMYNLGVCKYRKGDYSNSIKYFENIADSCSCKFVEEGGQHQLIVLAYNYYMLGDIPCCNEMVNRYRKIEKMENSLDIFVLRYLCGEYNAAAEECNNMLREWYPDYSVWAMVADCVDSGIVPMKTIEKNIDGKSMRNLMKLIANLDERRRYINQYRYVVPFINYYIYIT